MGGYLKKIFFAFLALFFLFLTSYAQDATSDKKTVVIALDKSTSMKEEIESVKEYMFELIDTKINIGDNLIIIPFYGKNDKPISLTVKSQDDKESVKRRLKAIFATGWYTDIGNALDVLRNEVNKLTNDTNKKSLIMVTDGIHDPPPTAMYKTKEDYADNEFLLRAREEVVKEGWKVIYLDIGGKSDPTVVDKLSTHYVKTEENLTGQQLKQEISEKMPSLDTVIAIDGKVTVKPINSKGNSKIIIPLKVENLKTTEVMSIEGIELEKLILFKINVVNAPNITKFTQDGKLKVEIPVVFEGDLTPGKYKDNMKFIFSPQTKEHFNRVIDGVEFKINNFFENNILWFLLLLLIILGVIILAVYLLSQQISKSKIKFKLLIDEAPLPENKNSFKIVQGKFLYLTEEDGNLTITKTRSISTIARLSCIGKRLKMSVLNDDKVPAARDLPIDMLGYKFVVLTDRKQQFHVKFEKI